MRGSRTGARAQATALAIIGSGGSTEAVLADGGSCSNARPGSIATVRRFGRIDIAVNNAGVALTGWPSIPALRIGSASCASISPAPFLTARAAARRMVEQGGGRIIQIGSISGQRGNMGGIALWGLEGGGHAYLQGPRRRAFGSGRDGQRDCSPVQLRPGSVGTGRHESRHISDRIPTHSYGTAWRP